MITGKLLTNNSLTIIFDNCNQKQVLQDHPRWEDILEAYYNNDDKQLEELISVDYVQSYSNDDFIIQDGELYYNGTLVSGVDAQRYIEFLTNKHPYKPLERFMRKKLNNVSKRSIDELYNFLENKNIPINNEGNIIAYKGVDNDYYSIYSGREKLIQGRRDNRGRIYNGIGEVVEMERKDVDDNCNRGCSAGLHAGNLDYAISWGKRVVLVEIDPADVVSIPNDAKYSKLRCNKYKVIGEYSRPLPNSYYNDSNDIMEDAKDTIESDDDWNNADDVEYYEDDGEELIQQDNEKLERMFKDYINMFTSLCDNDVNLVEFLHMPFDIAKVYNHKIIDQWKKVLNRLGIGKKDIKKSMKLWCGMVIIEQRFIKDYANMYQDVRECQPLLDEFWDLGVQTIKEHVKRHRKRWYRNGDIIISSPITQSFISGYLSGK